MERVRGSQDGERKTITVLFADIASSTALIDDRDAEDARRILKPTVDAMIDIVHHYEGITDEEGDGIMASFGAPIALEDHAIRACYAALDMQEASRIRAAAPRRAPLSSSEIHERAFSAGPKCPLLGVKRT